MTWEQRTAAGLVLLALALATGCRRSPRCHGELESDDLFRLQELNAEGKYPCTEHLEPVVEVDRTGVTLSGRRVASADELPRGAPRRIKGLFDALKSNREIWKQVHPGEEFAPRPKVRIDGGSDFVVGASALMTVAYSGYPTATVSAGNVSFEMYYDVPRPPSPDGEQLDPRELWVTRVDARTFSASLRRGSVREAASPDLAFDALPGWVAGQCGADPCARTLVLDLGGDFVVAATLVRTISDGPGFRTRPPLLRFVIPAT